MTKRSLYHVLLGGMAGLAVLSPAPGAAQRDCAPGAPACTPATSAPIPEAAAAADLIRLAATVTPALNGTAWSVGSYSSTLSYATPAYVSRDQPRSVSLYYASGQAAPVGYVSVDAVDNSTDTPVKMSIQLRNPWGYWVTNEIFYTAAHGANRLSASFDASAYGTGTYNFSVQVRTYWPDGTFTEAPIQSVRVFVVNENSAVAPGWTVPGFQHIYGTTSSAGPQGLTLVDGAGNALFFEQLSCGTSCSYRSPRGDFSTLVWAADGSLTRTFPDGSIAYFTSNGLVSYVQDRFGNRTTFGWRWTTESASRPVPASMTDPAGKVITFGYSDGVHLNTITDPAGRQTLIYYAANGTDIQSIQAPGGSVPLQVAYDGSHRVTQWQDHGNAWNYTYSAASGTLASVVSPTVLAGGVNQPLTTSVTTLLTAVLPAAGKGTSSVPADRVDPAAVRVVVTDPRGTSNKTQVDTLGLPVQVEDGLNRVTTFTRNGLGQVTHTTAPGGVAVSYEWTGMDLKKVRDEAAGDSTTYTYGSSTCPHQPTEASTYSTETVTDFVYGSSCELLKQTWITPGRKPVVYAYDATSHYRLLSLTDSATGRATRYYYGGNAWANTDSATSTSTTQPAQTVRFAYDSYGRTSSTRDAVGQTTSVTYDLLNRPLSTTDPASGVTRIGYNGVFADTLVDPTGKQYVSTHNAVGWVTAQADPTGTQTIGYDVAGRVVSRTNRRGQTITTTYDALDRPLTVTTPDVGVITYAYDPLDGWMSASNGESTDSVYYGGHEHGLGYVVSRRSGISFVQLYCTTCVGPDTVYGISITPAGGTAWTRNVGYRYSATWNDLSQVRDMSGGYTTLFRDTARQVTGVQYPGGTVTLNLGYNARGMLTSQSFTSGVLNDALMPPGYAYDALNENVTRTWLRADSTFTRSMSYDLLGRLGGYTDTRVYPDCVETGGTLHCTNVSGTVGSASYGYDAVGNRTDSGATMQVGNNKYNTFGGYTLGYDADGNLVSKTGNGLTQTLAWNSLGQLSSVTTNGSTVSFGYDGFGMRVRRTAGSVVTRYLYDQGNLAAETDGSGNVLRAYTNYPGIDAPLSVYDVATNKQYYYATELPGHVTGLFDAAGNLVDKYRYAPFGSMVAGYPSESVAQPLKYMARELDSATGLYYVRNRWYDPALDRFVSEDPIGLAGGINQYAYAGNDPVNATDPSGLTPCSAYDHPDYCGQSVLVSAQRMPSIWWIYQRFGLEVGPVVGMLPGGPQLASPDDPRPPPNWDKLAALALTELVNQARADAEAARQRARSDCIDRGHQAFYNMLSAGWNEARTSATSIGGAGLVARTAQFGLAKLATNGLSSAAASQSGAFLGTAASLAAKDISIVPAEAGSEGAVFAAGTLDAALWGAVSVGAVGMVGPYLACGFNTSSYL